MRRLHHLLILGQCGLLVAVVRIQSQVQQEFDYFKIIIRFGPASTDEGRSTCQAIQVNFNRYLYTYTVQRREGQSAATSG